MLGLAPMAGGGGNTGTPLSGPGSAGLEAWYRWDLQQEFAALLYTTDVGAAAVSVTWPAFTAMGLQVRVKAGGTGTRSTCVLEWSARNGDGTDWTSIGPGLGATVNLTGGVVLNLPTATYTAGQTWKAIRASLRDNKNAHHFISQDATPNFKNPIPLVTTYGTFLQFNGVDSMLRCITSLAPNVAGGTTKAWYGNAVVYIDGLLPSSGTGTILWFGDGASSHAIFVGTVTAGPAWRAGKQNDAGSTLGKSGGTPATATPYSIGFYTDGTNVTIRVNGTTVINNLALVGGALASLSVATLGKSFNGGAEGNPLAYSLGEMALYSTAPTASEQVVLESRARARFGF